MPQHVKNIHCLDACSASAQLVSIKPVLCGTWCAAVNRLVVAMQRLDPLLLDCCLPAFKVLDGGMVTRLAHVDWTSPKEWVVGALTSTEQDSAGGFIVSLLARAEQVLLACLTRLFALRQAGRKHTNA